VKTILKGLTISQLEDFITNLGEPKFRAKQLFQGIYRDRLSSFEEFTTLSKSLIAKLNEVAELPSLKVGRHLTSKDGTHKMTFKVEEEKEVEAVWIPSGDDGQVRKH
jgi:23S rRNA (adenine2503-C2)-methyltransferase